MLPSLFRHRNDPALSRDPFREMEDMFKRFSMDSSSGMFQRGFGNIDVMETETAHVVKVDLPGMKKDDIKIQVDEDNVLTVSGERQRTDEKKEANYQVTERHFGKFSRSFQLPEDVKMQGITADMKSGVLSISIPKNTEAPRRPKAVEVPINEVHDEGGHAAMGHTNGNKGAAHGKGVNNSPPPEMTTKE